VDFAAASLTLSPVAHLFACRRGPGAGPWGESPQTFDYRKNSFEAIAYFGRPKKTRLRLGWKRREGAVLSGRVGAYAYYGFQVQGAVNVRVRFLAIGWRLLAQGRSKPSGVDREQHQVRHALVEGVRHAGHLVGVAAVNEADLLKSFVSSGQLIATVSARVLPVLAAREVIDVRRAEKLTAA
jgi:hypothetical protein